MIDGHSDGPSARAVVLAVTTGTGAVWKFAPAWLPEIGYGAAGIAGAFLLAGVGGAVAGAAIEAARARRVRRERATVERAAEIVASKIVATASNSTAGADPAPAAATHAPEAVNPGPAAIAAASATVTPMCRAQQVAAFMKDYRERTGKEATFSQVRDALGLPASTASKYRDAVLKQAQG